MGKIQINYQVLNQIQLDQQRYYLTKSMAQTIIVTSPFFQNNIQLFYQASLNTKNHTISLKIFNHRGVLKNRRIIDLQIDIVDLFAAEEYLIGLDSNHENVCIIDIRKYKNCTVRGCIKEENGFSQEMKQRNLKFNSFIYDRVSNHIFGLLDNHHVFYFRINRSDHYSALQSNQDLSIIAQANKNISIRQIYSSTESIDKLEVKNQKRIQKIESKEKKSFEWKPLDKIYESSVDESVEQSQSVSLICVLVKVNKVLRTIEINWNTDKILKIQQTAGVYDFCFKNGWDLIVKYAKGDKRQLKKTEVQNYEFKTECKGYYNNKIQLSDSHVIFCSEQDIFVIDPELQNIAGVYNKEYREIKNCESIPKSINHSNTIMMVSITDQFYLRFLFQVFDTIQGNFTYTPLRVPLKNLQQTAELERYLKKNIENIYTKNAFIHDHFKEKVISCLQSINEKNEMMEQDQSNEFSTIKESINPSLLAKLFLQKFVMQDAQLMDRLTYSLINSGQKSLFADKSQSKQKHQENSILKSQPLLQMSSSIQVNQKHQNQNKLPRCYFDRWNQYFEEIIYQQYRILKDLFVQNQNQNQMNEKEEENSEYSNNVLAKFQKLNKNLDKIKSKLTMISNFYNRLLKTSQNRTKSHSLFLIFDLFHQTKLIRQNITPQQQLQALQQAVTEVFKQFDHQKQQNVNLYKTSLNNFTQPISLKDQSNFQNGQVTLLLHQHFSNARGLIVQRVSFELLLEHLILSLDEFQETAYFYYLIRSQLQKNNKNEQRQLNVYPLMGKNLLNFFSLATHIPPHSSIDWQNEIVDEYKRKIQDASKYALSINKQPFTRYIIQLSSQYYLPSTLLKLINSIKLQPYLLQHKHSQDRFSHNEISSQFIYNEKLIIRSLIFCGMNVQTNKYTNSKRELLMFAVKRILQISDLLSIDQGQTRIRKTSIKHSLQQSFIQSINESKQQQSYPVSHSTQIKRQLLRQFILSVLSRQFNQNIRQLEELKNECLTLEQDKSFVSQMISPIIRINAKQTQAKEITSSKPKVNYDEQVSKKLPEPITTTQ